MTNKIFLKERLFGYKMNTTKSLEQNLDEFFRITIELANLGEGEALNDENQAIILLNSMPNSYKEVKSTIKYERTSITLEEVLSALRLRDLELKTERQSTSSGENYLFRGRSHQRNNNQRGKSNSKFRGRSSLRGANESKKCYHYGKIGHIKKHCYTWLRKNKDKNLGANSDNNRDSTNLGDGYDSGEVLVASIEEQCQDWLRDSGCTYYTTFNKEWLTN